MPYIKDLKLKTKFTATKMMNSGDGIFDNIPFVTFHN